MRGWNAPFGASGTDPPGVLPESESATDPDLPTGRLQGPRNPKIAGGALAGPDARRDDRTTDP
jgi:hypothetical protein